MSAPSAFGVKPSVLFLLGLAHVVISNIALMLAPTWQLQLTVLTWLIIVGMIPSVVFIIRSKENLLMAYALPMIIPLVGFGCAFAKLATFGHLEFYRPAIFILCIGCLSFFLSLYRDTVVTIEGLLVPETRRIFLDHIFDLLVASTGLGVICYMMIFQPLQETSGLWDLNFLLAVTTWIGLFGLVHRSFATSISVAMVFLVAAAISSLNANSFLAWEASQSLGEPYTVFRFHGLTIALLILATVHSSYGDLCRAQVEPQRIGFVRALLIGAIACITPIVGVRNGDQSATIGGVVTAFMVMILLVRMVQMVREREQRIHERDELTKALQFQATHDALTGLSNRSYLIEQLTLRLKNPNPEQVSILYCDLNHFKPINDKHGHAAGDFVLREVGIRLRETVGPNFLVGRFGGDEFVVVIEDPNAKEKIAPLCDRLKQAINETPYVLECGDLVYLGLAIGVAHGYDGVDADQLIALADADMYEAKHPTNKRLQQMN
ncbi:GGDEF domain-containing protein [Stomatohabitans albus]|uniref:GGDEF domain-containing protein n=1 Tax=Stomatohabitans albus TaxID=3110766 RepID=UPI00300D92B8